MAGAIEQLGKSPIRPAVASVFKKTTGERGYNTIVKSQKTASVLMEGNQTIPAQDAKQPVLDRPQPQYSQQTLDTIKGCLVIAKKNLEKQDVRSYLVDNFGEDQAQQILQEKTTAQQQLEQQYQSIIENKKDK